MTVRLASPPLRKVRKMRGMSTITITVPDGTGAMRPYEYQTSPHPFFAEDCLAVRVRDGLDRDRIRVLKIRNGDLPINEIEVGGYTPTVARIVNDWLDGGRAALGHRGSSLATTPVVVNRNAEGWTFA